MTTTAYLDARRLRAGVRRHPWVYTDSVSRVEGDYQAGDAVVVRAPDGRFLAHGLINDGSKLRLRLVSFDRAREITPELLAERVRSAVALRHEVLALPARADAYRLVHSEGDGLPGLIVDRYGEVLVYTCSALGIHQRLDPILDELEALLAPRAIVERGVSEGLRGREGLPPGRGVVRGDLPHSTVEVTIDGLRLEAPLEGQKTGLFLDQRENVQRVAALAAGRKVLDACCYGGAFGLACARAGAARVLAFDSSPEATELCQRNAARNEVAERVEVRRASLYKALHDLAAAGETYDLVVLDPPKFAPTARDLKRARKGYLDANLLALKVLAPGGLLLTCSCSGHVGEELFEGILRQAIARSGRELRLLERRGAGPDHPVDPNCPEGRYLKAFLLQARS
ncbi:MAG: class I SAM-dependent rRNA methyltransferase [Planctomycetota bacterium]